MRYDFWLWILDNWNILWLWLICVILCVFWNSCILCSCCCCVRFSCLKKNWVCSWFCVIVVCCVWLKLVGCFMSKCCRFLIGWSSWRMLFSRLVWISVRCCLLVLLFLCFMVVCWCWCVSCVSIIWRWIFSCWSWFWCSSLLFLSWGVLMLVLGVFVVMMWWWCVLFCVKKNWCWWFCFFFCWLLVISVWVLRKYMDRSWLFILRSCVLVLLIIFWVCLMIRIFIWLRYMRYVRFRLCLVWWWLNLDCVWFWFWYGCVMICIIGLLMICV